MLCVAVVLLAAGMFLPLIQPPSATSLWRGGLVLSQFGPHLVTGKADPILIYVGMFLASMLLALLLLLGLARMVGQVLWVVAMVTSSLLVLLSALLWLGVSVSEDATTGVGVIALPIGAMVTFLSCVIPPVKDAWVRPKAF